MNNVQKKALLISVFSGLAVIVIIVLFKTLSAIPQVTLEYSSKCLDDYYSEKYSDIVAGNHTYTFAEKPLLNEPYTITLIDTNGKEVRGSKATITFIDTTPPVLKFADNVEITNGHGYIKGIVLSDNYEELIIPKVYYIDGYESGLYHARFVAEDSSGNQTKGECDVHITNNYNIEEFTQEFEWVEMAGIEPDYENDPLKPIITAPTNTFDMVYGGDEPDYLSGVVAKSVRGDDLDVYVEGTVNAYLPQEYQLYYVAIDPLTGIKGKIPFWVNVIEE